MCQIRLDVFVAIFSFGRELNFFQFGQVLKCKFIPNRLGQSRSYNMVNECGAFWVMYYSILWPGDARVLWCFFSGYYP